MSVGWGRYLHIGIEGRIKRCGDKGDRWVSRVGARRRMSQLKQSFLLLL